MPINLYAAADIPFMPLLSAECEWQISLHQLLGASIWLHAWMSVCQCLLACVGLCVCVCVCAWFHVCVYISCPLLQCLLALWICPCRQCLGRFVCFIM